MALLYQNMYIHRYIWLDWPFWKGFERARTMAVRGVMSRREGGF